VDCHSVKVAVAAPGESPSAIRARLSSAASAEFVIPGASVSEDGGATTLVVSVGDRPVHRFTLERASAGADDELQADGDDDGDDGDTDDTVTLAGLLARDCRSEFSLSNEPYYDRREQMAHFVVTPVGNVLRRPAPVIDESDSVRVDVLADSRLLPLLKVRRSSAIRTVGAVRFIGEDTNLSGIFEPEAEELVEGEPPPCGVQSYVLRDFEPGKGEVEIRALTGKSEADEMTQAVGTFDFNVNPLYSGAFSLGAMRTELSEPEFGINVDGADSTITVRSNGPYRIRYVLMYTHFIWGKRDVEKLPSNLWERINPSIGVVLDDIPENFVGGLTADLFEGVYLSGGAHFGRVKELDPNSGFSVGDTFSGDEDDIPTLERWRVKPFFSVGVDVRAAAELLRMALTGSKGGG